MEVKVPDQTPVRPQSVHNSGIRQLKAERVGVDDRDVRLLPLIDGLLERCVKDGDVPKYVQDQEIGENLARLYPKYKEQLTVNNRLDFPSLLYAAHRLLHEVQAIARQIRTVYKHVCVEEFQDTNLAQYRVLRAIVGNEPTNLFVVADDDQIIYQ